MSTREIVTVKQAVKTHPFLTEGGLRFQIFNEDSNGLKEAGVVLRSGRKVLIDMDRYFTWLDAKNGVLATESLIGGQG